MKWYVNYNKGTIFGIPSDKEIISVSKYFDKLLSYTRFILGWVKGRIMPYFYYLAELSLTLAIVL